MFPSAWAKLGTPQHPGWRSLLDHSLDMAAVCLGLLRNRLIAARLASLADLPHLTDVQIARLAVFAGMHDLGKANLGFQNKGFSERFPKAGHLGEIASILDGRGIPLAQDLVRTCQLQRICGWFADGELGLCSHLLAIFSHHGRPVEIIPFRREIWKKSDTYDPISEAGKVVQALLATYPEAQQGETIPAMPAFVHAFAGLVTLADWIASDTRFFPLLPLEQTEAPQQDRYLKAVEALSLIGLGHAQTTAESLSIEQILNLPAGSGLRPAQQALEEIALPEGASLLVLEADTGSGKTEAALIWFLRLFSGGLVDGLYFALPTRAAARQIHGRVASFAQNALGPARPPAILAVPGYVEVDGVQGEHLPGFEVLWPDSEADRLRHRAWAAEHPKRYLAGRIVVGTVDQVLLSALQVNHSHMRATALLRHLLVVDEVHASDQYMTHLLEEVLKRHLKAGGHALLMSATLGEAARARLLKLKGFPHPKALSDAGQEPYPVIWQCEGNQTVCRPLSHHKPVRVVSISLVPACEAPDRVATLALDAASLGARVGIIRNTVSGAIDVQQALESEAEDTHVLFECDGKPAPHHGRFARADRLLLDEALEKRLREDKPVVTSATQTIEQSLDIDFDLIITDLCPMDVLIQRLGRLHRHDRSRPEKFKDAHAVVLIPDKSLTEFLTPQGEAYGPSGIGTVYEDLAVLQATLEALKVHSSLRLPEESRVLIEAATHPEALKELTDRLGGLWIAHWSIIWGKGVSKTNVADLNLVDWDQPFEEVHFDQSADIPTRLGEKDRLLTLPGSPIGPFGQPVEYLILPAHLARRLPPEAAVENLQPGPEGFVFSVGGQRFRYDRLGLRSEKEK